MFADLSGFTTLSETADAEDVRNLVNTCFERLGTVATRLGGHIDKFIGDELMVLFGAPQAMEDHASRALVAALEMREALGAFNEEHAHLAANPLGMHFGINSGLVIAGDMGPEARRDYTVMGDPVNVAARLAAQAPTGSIYVGADSRRLVGPGFEFNSRGAFTLAGREQPVEVFELDAISGTAPTTRSVHAETALFGRADELRTLRELLDDVAGEQRPRSVAIVGPAGIGKSRLLAEFQRWATAERPEVVLLAGSATPHTSMIPYHLIADFIRRLLDVRESETPADIRSHLDTRLRQIGIDDPAQLEAIAMVLAVESETGRLKDVDPHERSKHLSMAVVNIVRSMASLSPLILALEDLHWADDQSIDLIEKVLAELVEGPILFLTTTRPIADQDENKGERGATALFTADASLVLGELQDEVSVQLVHALAPGLETSPDVVQTIVRKGQGTPLFVEAIVGTLFDQGVLAGGSAGEGTSVQGAVDDVSVPDTVWAVLAERIDRLGADQKQALQMASIVGREFWDGLVGELTGMPEIDTRLRSLEEQAFIESVGPATFDGEWEWTFRHVLVQDVAYAGMLRAVRRAAHLRVGAWLEQRAGERRGEFAPLLAYHFERGEDWQRTAELAEESGDRAAHLFANREAGLAYRQGLEALALLPPEPTIQRRMVELTLKFATVGVGFPTEELLPALETAKTLADELADDALAQRVWGASTTLLWLKYSGRGFN